MNKVIDYTYSYVKELTEDYYSDLLVAGLRNKIKRFECKNVVYQGVWGHPIIIYTYCNVDSVHTSEIGLSLEVPDQVLLDIDMKMFDNMMIQKMINLGAATDFATGSTKPG